MSRITVPDAPLPNAPVVKLPAPAVRELEPMLIAPKPLPMLPPVNAPTEVMAGCAAVVTVPAVVAVAALPVTFPVNAPTKVVAPSEPVEGFHVSFE